jgi:uncharacterized repeat protein (TIGR03803 family)
MKKITILSLASLCAVLTTAQKYDRIESSNSTCYGMTAGGGHKGYGVVFSYTTGTGKDSIRADEIVAKANSPVYGEPQGGTLLLANDGYLYGTSQYGALFGLGGVYRFNTVTGKDSLVLNFNWINGDCPQGPLMQAKNGDLYGTTLYGGTAGQGVIFSFNPVTGADSVVFNFDGINGGQPYYGKLVEYNGLLYGMTLYGGTNNDGVLFSVDPKTYAYNILVNFDSLNGKGPYGGLYLAKDSMMYGMVTNGGTNDNGLLFRFNPKTNQDTILYYFNNASGTQPFGTLMQATNGLLYGTTFSAGSAGYGTMFCYDPVKFRDSVLINFNVTNGAEPNGDNGLFQASNGILYGTTFAGGNVTYPYGVMYSYNPTNGNDSVLINFTQGYAGGLVGSEPFAGVVQDPKTGELFGVTQYGGSYFFGGTIWRYNLLGKNGASLLSLGGSSSNNGYITEANTNGMIYGMTSYGGNIGAGTLFQLNPNTNATTIKYQFDGTHGMFPYGKLFQSATDSNLYGTTAHGDTDFLTTGQDNGTVFKYNIKSNTLASIYSYGTDSGIACIEPHGGVIQAKDGRLYGTMLRGTTLNQYGSLYSIDPKTPHKGATDIIFVDSNGSTPWWGVMQASNKLLYGLTLMGGTNGKGVLFSYNTVTKVDSTIISFDGLHGSYPFGGLLQSSLNSKLYGMTSQGGTNGDGVLFRFDCGAKTDTVVLNFNGTNGATPISSLVQDSAGMLYGTTRYGGTHNNGVLFMFNPINNHDSVLLNFNADSGANPTNIIIFKAVPLAVANVDKPSDLLMVYPNPFKDAATLVFGEAGTHYVELYDMQGKLMNTIKCNSKQCNISRNNMPAGMYFIKVYDGNMKYQSSAKIEVAE